MTPLYSTYLIFSERVKSRKYLVLRGSWPDRDPHVWQFHREEKETVFTMRWWLSGWKRRPAKALNESRFGSSNLPLRVYNHISPEMVTNDREWGRNVYKVSCSATSQSFGGQNRRNRWSMIISLQCIVVGALSCLENSPSETERGFNSLTLRLFLVAE